MSAVSADLTYAAACVKWHAAGLTSRLARALESEAERKAVAPPASISDVERDMRECDHVGQPPIECDTYPSPEWVWWRRCQKPNAEAKIILDVQAAKAKKEGRKAPAWRPPIGDCQSFAVLAAERIRLLPPTEHVRVVLIVAISIAKPDGSTGGHAICAYQVARPKAAPRWHGMQQGGRVGGEDGLPSVRAVVGAIPKTLPSGGGTPRWWCEFSPKHLAVMAIHRWEDA